MKKEEEAKKIEEALLKPVIQQKAPVGTNTPEIPLTNRCRSQIHRLRILS
jgi:hypothetical protein